MSKEFNQILELDKYQRSIAREMEKQGYEAADAGDFAQAHYHFYFAYCHLVTIRLNVPKDKKNAAVLLSARAQVLYMQGCNEYGEQLSQEAIAAFQNYLQSGPNEADGYEVNNYIALCHMDIAGSSIKRDAFSKAIRNYHMALEIYEKLKNCEEETIDDCLNQLAFAYDQIGCHNFSMELRDAAVSRANACKGESNEQISRCGSRL